MIVDQFTKSVECIPLPSETADETARAVVNEFFSRFCIPFKILTDRGTNFESSLFNELCNLLHIHKTKTTANRPSANGQVERYKRTLMDAVRCYVGNIQTSWDIWLPQLAGALRSTVCMSTGYTPNMMMLGRKVYTPAELVFPSSKLAFNSSHDYVKQLEGAMQETHVLARSQLKQKLEVRKRDYDLR